MYVGMALAKYWDEDWELYSKVENHYEYLRDRIDFDHMDDYICEKVLLLNEEAHKAVTNVVAECASRSYSKLIHLNLQLEARKPSAVSLPPFTMFLMGIAVELKMLGYHMTKM